MKDKKGKEIAVRPDKIVEARYSLTAAQNDFLDIFLTEIDDTDENKVSYNLELKKYAHLFPKGKSKNIYRDMKIAVDALLDAKFYIHSEQTGDDKKYNWIAGRTYNNKKGTIDVEISKTLKEYLIQMKRGSYYKIVFPLSLYNTYSKRLYYMLKQYQDTGWRIDNVDDLRSKLECPVSYNKYSLFKAKVLETAIIEINEKTDIWIDYEEIFNKNKVIRIKFNVNENVINAKRETIDLYTNLQLTDTDYEEIRRLAHQELEEDYKEDAERYVIWTTNKMDPDKIKFNKKAYLKKVLISDQNKNDFISEIEMERRRKRNVEAYEEIEKQLEDEMNQQLQEKMKEHGVSTPEELSEKLAGMFGLNKNRN